MRTRIAHFRFSYAKHVPSHFPHMLLETEHSSDFMCIMHPLQRPGQERRGGVFVCRVAVLDGGLPLWLSEGYNLDEAPVSEEELAAGRRAAQQPPSHAAKYKAHLQVQHMHAPCFAQATSAITATASASYSFCQLQLLPATGSDSCRFCQLQVLPATAHACTTLCRGYFCHASYSFCQLLLLPATLLPATGSPAIGSDSCRSCQLQLLPALRMWHS